MLLHASLAAARCAALLPLPCAQAENDESTRKTKNNNLSRVQQQLYVCTCQASSNNDAKSPSLFFSVARWSAGQKNLAGCRPYLIAAGLNERGHPSPVVALPSSSPDLTPPPTPGFGRSLRCRADPETDYGFHCKEIEKSSTSPSFDSCPLHRTALPVDSLSLRLSLLLRAHIASSARGTTVGALVAPPRECAA